MPYPQRYAVLLDGAFVIKKLQEHLGRFPTAEDIEASTERLHSHPAIKDLDLLRVYFYHAPPAADRLKNPLDKSELKLSTTATYKNHESLLDRLEMQPNVALRLGETVTHQWRLGSSAMKSIEKKSRPVQPQDLVPNITQKGVDLRLGLDISRLSLKQMVQVIVVATGDSDLVPAFKFARREGVRIFLDHMQHGVRRDLKAHADLVLDLPVLGGK